MVTLSRERIEKILHEETVKKEESTTILRAVYSRYRELYEQYFADIDALNDEKIAAFRAYNEETISLVKYYWLDIPHDVSVGIYRFESECGTKLLGRNWHEYLFSAFEDFESENEYEIPSGSMKAEFSRKALECFYETMSYVFREGFGTGSATVRDIGNGIMGILFGKSQTTSARTGNGK